MRHGVMMELEELLRETYEGGVTGQGTRYLDHVSGIHTTLSALTAVQASKSPNGHPSIAGHARHMAFHLRAVAEWIEGDHRQRDWVGSFQPFEVNEEDWRQLRAELDEARDRFVNVMHSLSDDVFVREGSGMAAIAHLAYHLGAIRQLMHYV